MFSLHLCLSQPTVSPTYEVWMDTQPIVSIWLVFDAPSPVLYLHPKHSHLTAQPLRCVCIYQLLCNFFVEICSNPLHLFCIFHYSPLLSQVQSHQSNPQGNPPHCQQMSHNLLSGQRTFQHWNQPVLRTAISIFALPLIWVDLFAMQIQIASVQNAVLSQFAIGVEISPIYQFAAPTLTICWNLPETWLPHSVSAFRRKCWLFHLRA